MVYEVDLQKIANNLDFDLEDVEMLIEVFLESAKESLQTLKNAIDTYDIENIFKSAHAIKGSASNLTLEKISNLAKEIEFGAMEKKDIDYQKKYKKLYSLVDQIKIK